MTSVSWYFAINYVNNLRDNREMPQRILISRDEIRVSKPGFDVNTQNPEELILFNDMNVMAVYLSGSCYLEGEDSRFYFDFLKPIQNMPYVILTSNDGVGAGRSTYFCEMQQNEGVYKEGKIRNLDGKGRTIWFCVLRGF